MSRSIISEQQAERVGERVTGGKRDAHFTVFWFEQPRTHLTMFGIEITATGHTVTVDDPRATELA